MVAFLNIFLLIITQIYGRKFKLKLQNSSLYLGDIVGKKYPSFISRELSDTFTSRKVRKRPGWVFIYVDGTKNKVFDIEGGGKNLLYWGIHRRRNQQFKIIPVDGNLVAIKSAGNRCLTFIKKKERLQRVKCNGSKGFQGQLFEMVDPNYSEPKKEEEETDDETDSKTDESSVSDSKNEEPNPRIPSLVDSFGLFKKYDASEPAMSRTNPSICCYINTR